MNRFGIKYQILLIALIPAFLVDVFFTWTHFSNNVDQAYTLLQSKGEIVTKQLTGAAEFNMLSGNYQQIQHLLDNTIDTNAIVHASVYDEAGNVIAKAISDDYDPKKTDNYFYYRQAIVSQSIQDSDVFAPHQSYDEENRTIGWVHLNISRSQLEQTKTKILYESLSFFIAILLLALTLSVIISGGITRPIFTLLNHLKQVETGQLGHVIESLEANEVGELQKGFNRMTQALLANRNDLNEKVHLATRQLSDAIEDLKSKNSELGFAKDEAQHANKIKSIFLTNMSHEIRTPINGISGFINLMAQSDLNLTQKRYADIILKSTNDLTDIISEILDFSKMESGKLQVFNDSFDLYEVVQQTRDILFINVLPKNIDLILIIYSDTPRYVNGDKLRLKQVLLNLIGNAIKFTDEGEVVIKVSVDQQTETDVSIVFTVEDTGIGISEKNQKTLFEAFSQVETSTNRRFAGTGLGLVISKNLVGLMAGEISMQSHVDIGTKFTVQLPFSLPKLPAHNPEITRSHKVALILSSRKTCLQEVTTLFDGAQISTESILISDSDSAEHINANILKNLSHIDFLVFDLRHLATDLNQILENIATKRTRIIIMHYDQSMVKEQFNQSFEFLSITSNSQALEKALDFHSKEPTATTSTERVPSTPLISKQVLLVDDNQINLKLGGELIRLWGHQAHEAENAHQAMDLYRNKRFDLIVLDIQMPEIDGIDLLKMMRQNNPQDTTPIVALTANTINEESEKLLKLGFNYYLSKPINEGKFRAILDGSYQINIENVSELESDNNTNCIRPSFDLEQSLRISQNNKSILRKILEILVRDIPGLQQQLKAASDQYNLEKLSAILHKIHGITCYTSLPRLEHQVRALQQFLAVESNDLQPDMVLVVFDELEVIKGETLLALNNWGKTVEV